MQYGECMWQPPLPFTILRQEEGSLITINHEKCKTKTALFFCTCHSSFSSQTCQLCMAVTLAKRLTAFGLSVLWKHNGECYECALKAAVVM